MITNNKVVYIIIVSYKNSNDIIEAIRHIFYSDYDYFKVIVCDNSNDNEMTINNIHKSLINELNTTLYSAEKVYKFKKSEIPNKFSLNIRDILLINTEENRGYSAGNNIGIKIAQNQNDSSFFWILNGDTAIKNDAMSKLVKYSENNTNIGLIGATLVDFDNHNRIQAIGGAYWNKKKATAKRYGQGLLLDKLNIIPAPDRPLDLIVGASMFVTKEFIHKTGLLNEHYFLYCEEIDWATRGRINFDIGVATDAIVYHKQETDQKSGLMWKRWLYFHRAKLIFTYHFYPEYFIYVSFDVTLSLFRRIEFIFRRITIPLFKSFFRLN